MKCTYTARNIPVGFSKEGGMGSDEEISLHDGGVGSYLEKHLGLNVIPALDACGHKRIGWWDSRQAFH